MLSLVVQGLNGPALPGATLGGAVMAKHCRLSLFGVTLVILALAGLSIGDPYSGSAAPGGLQNPGFEQGLTNWTAVAADAAVVVGTESSTQCATYTDMGGLTVAPFKGAKSLREGTCRRNNQSQPKGTNKVSQTFVADSATLKVAFRLFSWEHRGNDEFLLELKAATQRSGR